MKKKTCLLALIFLFTLIAGVKMIKEIKAADIYVYTVSAQTGPNWIVVAPASKSVPSGNTTYFTFNASRGYHITSISGCDGIPYTNSANSVISYTYNTGAITANCAVAATVAGNTYTISAVAYSGGGIADAKGKIASTTKTIIYPNTASFVFNADPGYHISSIWGCDGLNVSDNSTSYTYNTKSITANCTVKANFIKNGSYTVSASTSASGGTFGIKIWSFAVPTAKIPYGNTASIGINGTAGYHITSISGCDGIPYTNSVNSIKNYTFETGVIRSDCVVNLTGAADSYTISAITNAGGSVVGATGKVASTTKRITYPGIASFTFNANSGYHIASIKGCNGTNYVNNNVTSAVTNSIMSRVYTTGATVGDCIVSATFAIDTYKININYNSDQGSVELIPGGPASVPSSKNGSPISMSANAGYYISSVSTNNAMPEPKYSCNAAPLPPPVINMSAGVNANLSIIPKVCYYSKAISGCGGKAYTNNKNYLGSLFSIGSSTTFNTNAAGKDCSIDVSFGRYVYNATINRMSKFDDKKLEGTRGYGVFCGQSFGIIDDNPFIKSVTGCGAWLRPAKYDKDAEWTSEPMTGNCTATVLYSTKALKTMAPRPAYNAPVTPTPTPSTKLKQCDADNDSYVKKNICLKKSLGFEISSTNCCTNNKVKGCTGLSFKEETLKEILNLPKECGTPVITGGTESGDDHAGSNQFCSSERPSHSCGFKFDLSNINQCLNDIIKRYPQHPSTRADIDPKIYYRSPTGACYYPEQNHFDVVVGAKCN